MNPRKATPEELVGHIAPFVGSSGGGQWSFQLQCQFCTDLGTVSAKEHSVGDPRHVQKAAQKFAAQGWRIATIPVCPKCYKRKFT